MFQNRKDRCNRIANQTSKSLCISTVTLEEKKILTFKRDGNKN